MSRREIFRADSPKTGISKRWEALTQLSDKNPYSFQSDEVGDNESYNSHDNGYEELLTEYSKHFPE